MQTYCVVRTSEDPAQVAPDALAGLRRWLTVQHEATREQMRQAWKLAWHTRHGVDELPARLPNAVEVVIDKRLTTLYDTLLIVGHRYYHQSEHDLLNTLARHAQGQFARMRAHANMGKPISDLLPSVKATIGTCYRVLLSDYTAHVDSYMAPRADDVEVF